MTDKQKSYYTEMAKRNRLIMLYVNGENAGLITFFIGNGKSEKYIERDNWSVVEDEPSGDTVYIDQLLTSKEEDNVFASLSVWRDVKSYFRDKFPLAKIIRWNRWKNRGVNI